MERQFIPKTEILKDIIKLISATILFIIMVELSAIWILIPHMLEIKNYDVYYVFIQGFWQLMVVVGFIYLLNRKNTQISWNKTIGIWCLIAALLGSMFIHFQSLLNYTYNVLFETNFNIAYDFDGIKKIRNINFLSTIIFIPVAEELFFRGYIQKELQKKLNLWIAIGVASILFALIHSPYLHIGSGNLLDWNLWHLFYITFFGGIFSGIIYFKSRSIIPAIVFHVFWNLTVIVV